MRSITGLDNFNKHGESDDAYLSLRKFAKIQMSRLENKNNISRGYVEWNNLTLRFIQFSRHKRNKLFYIKRHFYFPFCIATVISCFRLWIFQKERIKLDVSYILKFFRTINSLQKEILQYTVPFSYTTVYTKSCLFAYKHFASRPRKLTSILCQTTVTKVHMGRVKM